MKKIKAAFVKNLNKIVRWFQDEVIDFFQNLARDLKSMRSLLVWIYSFFFLWLLWYCVTHIRESAPTALTAMASVVGIAFTGYVVSKSYDKKAVEKNEKAKPDPSEDGAAD